MGRRVGEKRSSEVTETYCGGCATEKRTSLWRKESENE